uniref:Uncharacterized protein n=1 Tax=Ditylenchus dipsaci TaxID=166011 RepID=A0A915D4Z5_9BILA
MATRLILSNNAKYKKNVIATGSPGKCQWKSTNYPNRHWYATKLPVAQHKLPDAGDGTLLVIWWTATGN